MAQPNNALDQLIRSIVPSVTKGSSWLSLVGLVLGFILCAGSLLALISWLILGCWDGFVSPVIGLRPMDFSNASWCTATLLVLVAIVAILKESK